MFIQEDYQRHYLTVRSDFIVILWAIIVDMNISAMAVRIYCYLAYKAGCSEFCNADIKEALGIRSDHSISKYMKELVDGGYLVRQARKNNGLFAGYNYILTVCQKMTYGKNKNTDEKIENYHMSKNDNWCELKEEKEKVVQKEIEENIFNNINNINNNNIKKEKINKKEKKENYVFCAKNEIDLEFVRFLDYRKEIKKPYKSQKSVDMIYNRFLQMCNGSVSVAKQIVDNTIQNQWQGLFELKSNDRRYNINSNSKAYDIGIKA